jgi:hypothetical protein
MNIINIAIIASILYFFFNLANVHDGNYMVAIARPVLYFVILYILLMLFRVQEHFTLSENFENGEQYSCESPVNPCQKCI